MWFNGFMIVIDMAVANVHNPLLARYRDTLILGSFREDVCFVGGVDVVFQSPSLSHFCRANVPGGFIPCLWTDAGQRTEKLAQRAVRELEEGRVASAMVQLGRAVHPLIDMSCPVHAQGIAHTADPFEWCVEAMSEELRAMPIANAPTCVRFAEPTLAMAKLAQAFPADGTSSPWGRLLKRVGLRHPVTRTEAREQAAQLIPAAAGNTAALFDLFFAKAGQIVTSMVDPTPTEYLSALEMSQVGLRRWFAQLNRFFAHHGGTRHYGELLKLLDRCVVVRN